MAKYQILRWGDIPTGVRARDTDGTVSEHLHERFQNAVDAVATATDRVGTDAYLAEWSWGGKTERDGSAADVARIVAAELEESITTSGLREIKMQMIDSYGRAGTTH